MEKPRFDMQSRKRNTPLKIAPMLLLFLFVSICIPGAQIHAEGLEPSTSFFVPFQDDARDAYSTFRKRCVGYYGDYRRTRVAGHRHAGVDMKGKAGEAVHAVGNGRVAYRYWPFPNETVVVLHQLPDGEKIYSVYTHIVDIRVNPGDPVDRNTVIGRLFNEVERKRARFSFPHLHLEIRKNMEDMGRASFTSMSKAALDKYCIDPNVFFKDRLK